MEVHIKFKAEHRIEIFINSITLYYGVNYMTHVGSSGNSITYTNCISNNV